MNTTANSKQCTRCKETKNLSEFSDHPKALDGKQSQCKKCFAERARIRKQGVPCISCGKPKEIGIPKGAKLCISCSKTCYDCGVRPRAKQHRRCKICQAKIDKARKANPDSRYRIRKNKIKSMYSLSELDAVKLLSIRNCQSCGKEIAGERENHIDHCHKTGLVRGVLCFNCNAALGHVNDDITKLVKLISYLSKHNGLQDLDKAIWYINKLKDHAK